MAPSEMALPLTRTPGSNVCFLGPSRSSRTSSAFSVRTVPFSPELLKSRSRTTSFVQE